MSSQPSRHRQWRHPFAAAFWPAFMVGAGIGAVDVLAMESPVPGVVALAIAGFVITWLVPSRWLVVATTLTACVWIAHLIVRAPWWNQGIEKDPHDWAGVLAALPSLGSALLASSIQFVRRKGGDPNELT